MDTTFSITSAVLFGFVSLCLSVIISFWIMVIGRRGKRFHWKGYGVEITITSIDERGRPVVDNSERPDDNY